MLKMVDVLFHLGILRPCLRRPLARSRCLGTPLHQKIRVRSALAQVAAVRRASTQSALPPPVSWVSRVPSSVRPYLLLARLDKPIGTLLLYYPCSTLTLSPNPSITNFSDRTPSSSFGQSSLAAWSILMASQSLHAAPAVPLTYMALFGVGAFIMRGAGCTINDLWDRRLDQAVGRWLSFLTLALLPAAYHIHPSRACGSLLTY